MAIGRDALGGSINGGETNIAIGNYSLDANTSGDLNIGLGYVALTQNSTGSPVKNLEVNNIIVEVQKKKINTIGDLKNTIDKTLRSAEKTLLIVIYNNQNQRRYIGVKLD